MSGRDVALAVLRRVATQGAWASAALRAEIGARPGLDVRDRGLATELVYGVLRHRLQLDRAISSLGRRLKDLDPKLHDILRLAAYQLIFLDRIPEHAAVDEAVRQAKKRGGKKSAGQTNAILRKLTEKPPAERRPALPDLERDPIGHIAEASSLPRTLVERLIKDMGKASALAFGLANLERPLLSLRINSTLVRTEEERERVRTEVGGRRGEHELLIVLDNPGALPADLDAFEDGRVSAQDLASVLVVDRLVDPKPLESILDVCAAPGGKTCFIAEKMGDEGRVVAHDVTPEKLAGIERQAKRLELEIVETAKVLPAETERFDRVLVDAPCTGTGTLRRHPEARWRFRVEDIDRVTRIQKQVLEQGAARTKPGGRLIYSVCSVLRAEGQDIVEQFLSTHPEFEALETLTTRPDQPGHPDGFFGASFTRKPS